MIILGMSSDLSCQFKPSSVILIALSSSGKNADARNVFCTVIQMTNLLDTPQKLLGLETTKLLAWSFGRMRK